MLAATCPWRVSLTCPWLICPTSPWLETIAMVSRFFWSVLPAALGTLLLACGPAWADVIVLLSGCTIQGTLADREAFASAARARTEVAILLDTGTATPPQLRRVAVDDIDFVVLESDGAKHVIDVHGGADVESAVDPLAASRNSARYPYTEEPVGGQSAPKVSDRTGGGVALLLGGAATTIAGAMIDFDSQGSVTWGASQAASGTIDYDARNYVLMGIGGVMMLAGLTILAGPRQPAPPAVALGFAGHQPVLAYRSRF